MEKEKNVANAVTSKIRAEVSHGLRRRFVRGRFCFVCVVKDGFVAFSEADCVFIIQSVVSFSILSQALVILPSSTVNASSSDVSLELRSSPPNAPISLDFLLLDSFMLPLVRALVCVVSADSSCVGEA